MSSLGKHIRQLSSFRQIKQTNPRSNIRQRGNQSRKVMVRNIKPEESCFITGCDGYYEWALSWWYDCFSQYNKKYNLVFADFGMSQKARDWCSERGEVLQVRDKFTQTWFKKPIALDKSPYEYSVWIDLDCQVNKDLHILLKYAMQGFAVTIDTYGAYFCKMKNPVASGVVGVTKGHKILKDWVKLTREQHGKYRGDQEVLNQITKKYKTSLTKYNSEIMIMPQEMQWLRLAGENKNAAIMHWTGKDGNAIIKQRMKEKGILSL